MTTRLTRLAAVILLACVGGGMVAAWGGRERPEDTSEMTVDWDEITVGEEITVAGRIAVYGNEPHSYLAVRVEIDQSDFRLVQLEGALREELWELQGKELTVTGTVTREEIGPGFPVMIDVSDYQITS